MKTEKVQKASYAREVFDKLKAHKLAMLGVGVWILEILIVVFLPMIMNLDPYVSDYAAFDAAPSAAHPLGTDSIGRDLFARLIYGGRTSLLVGILSTLISLVIGVPLGLIAGYYRGAVEAVIMRVADVFMSFPSIVLILVLVSVLGPSVWSVTIVIGVLGWTSFARLIYANVLSVMEKEYVESARAVGTSDFWTIVKYILPNALPPILITVTFQTASAIITESSLSFLGMGVQPPEASWGNMLHDAQSITVLSRSPWVWLPPGLAIVITVLSINFFGDGVRDALDPKMKI
ncbi:MAG TPA: ABC transporter permease [Candidatus Gallacutalibacter pullicola]|uniref:ABC transporter permease n=1 Tax=Candidatus Gallacutalibacter pullicola TaxID=2840830 RepID=A0A9D1DSB7_9FIRM|nr:ABC transporter permease [Candidatus Gallacutalibacter pullicola]